ncbi:hypothetical protein XENTR_v10006921 [Xenopus tropicalis]|nr:hypothetical protein XENTR_v10006921 [Xenopus tropicalis]
MELQLSQFCVATVLEHQLKSHRGGIPALKWRPTCPPGISCNLNESITNYPAMILVYLYYLNTALSY